MRFGDAHARFFNCGFADCRFGDHWRSGARGIQEPNGGLGSLSFRFCFARHELCDGFADVHAFEKHGVYGFGDGHVDVVFSGESFCGAGSADTFGDHGRGGGDAVEIPSLGDFFSDGPVSGMAALACDDEVPHSAEPGECERVGSHCDAESCDFGEPACDERGLCVVAESESVACAGGDGDDVFERAAEFDADDVGAGVDAEGGRHEGFLNGFARGGV